VKAQEIVEILKDARKIRAYCGNSLNPAFGGWKRIYKKRISQVAEMFLEVPMIIEFEKSGEKHILCNDERLRILYGLKGSSPLS